MTLTCNGYMRVTCALHAHYMPCNAHVTPRKHYMPVTCPLHAHHMRNLPPLHACNSSPKLAQNLPDEIGKLAAITCM